MHLPKYAEAAPPAGVHYVLNACEQTMQVQPGDPGVGQKVGDHG